ncbi:MTHFR-domain-containing protein [Macrolepiota fuliginosa MF-IS2]|uniref:MTHFR-domain-containing protein n=1 Tax=Macrolepiota fuliginosa MF-IS2 TaxID=1400762 RepID=A0A9P5X827_9AGAR|nr:MTHFR-domain-containing protein [Macrolepiota fuliginosa MF-IS2]
MKFTDKFPQGLAQRPFFTFEFFPPRTDQGFENLASRISRLAALSPLGVSVTWGAGGATKDRSLELAALTQHEYGLDTLLHLTCTNARAGSVDAALKDAQEGGIENILALRGDPPRGQEEWVPSDPRFAHAIDLVTYIRESYGDHFCIGVAAYPDGHPDKLIDEDKDLDYLKAKVDAGANFIVTQLFYDIDGFLRWLKKVRERGITVPVIPGIMPIQTYSSFQRLTKLTGAHVPDHVHDALKPISHDDQLVKDYGVTLAVGMIRKLVSEGAVPGVHFCTLNLEKSVQRVLENLQWTGMHAHPHNRLIADLAKKSEAGSDLVVTPETATHDATQSLASITVTDGEAGRGELNNAASWDDFPNGRFGDFKSPAFGAQDPWGNSGVAINEMLKQWRNPKTLGELTQIFLDHLHSKISTTPFSPTPLSPESLTILPELEQLTKRGWWTVGSQPVVNGASSSDEVFGWGPRAGYVFQKGFVEFFCEEKDVDMLQKRIEEHGTGWVHFVAGNYRGDHRSNVPDDGRNAVTWGVFPGQEIIQTTIIERESFLSWKEEAFTIWSEWASCYRPGSEEHKLLESIRDRRWLINIIHHDYQNPRALWDFVLGKVDGTA